MDPEISQVVDQCRYSIKFRDNGEERFQCDLKSQGLANNRNKDAFIVLSVGDLSYTLNDYLRISPIEGFDTSRGIAVQVGMADPIQAEAIEIYTQRELQSN